MPKTDYVRQEHHEFQDAAREAMANPSLLRVLDHLGDLGRRNQRSWSELPDSDAVRETARRIKDDTLAHLDTHLATLEQNVLRSGGHVHWADDADQACQQIISVLKKHDTKKIVKSKSMTTEEIHLNTHLESAGITSVETDFGEYIIQLAGHRPSHIVGPALHLTARDVADIMGESHNQELPADRYALAAFAREKLRSEFASADVGITGANFAIAETGSIVLVTNEGNGRLTTSMPKVHIAVMGMEKVIPRLTDLPYFLKILARAASGQKLSVYTSMTSGASSADELDGPEEFHLVILDNGRSKILGSPLRESLFCIRCGACLNACPIYRNVGGHAYGGVYSGPIGAVLTPLYDGLAENHDLPHASSLCGACQAACPVKIQIPELLVKLREQLHEQPGSLSRRERIAYGFWAWSLRSPRLYGCASWLATRILGRWKRSNPWFSRLPGKIRGWTDTRDFPAPANERFRDWWRREGEAGQSKLP